MIISCFLMLSLVNAGVRSSQCWSQGCSCSSCSGDCLCGPWGLAVSVELENVSNSQTYIISVTNLFQRVWFLTITCNNGSLGEASSPPCPSIHPHSFLLQLLVFPLPFPQFLPINLNCFGFSLWTWWDDLKWGLKILYFVKIQRKLAAMWCCPLGLCTIDINLFETGIRDCWSQMLIYCSSADLRSLFCGSFFAFFNFWCGNVHQLITEHLQKCCSQQTLAVLH